jgi:hypothetical protein
MSYTDIYLDRSRPNSIVLRPATPRDHQDLIRVSQRDSKPIPAEPLLVAEVDGEIRAARSLADGETIADPFHPTARLLEMLEAHAAELLGEGVRQAAGRRGMRRRERLAPRSVG